MKRNTTTRRTFGAGLLTAATVGLSGCLGGDDDGEGDDASGADDTSDDDTNDDGGDDGFDFELDDPGTLVVRFENEDGEPVSSGLAVTITPDDEDVTYNHGAEIQDGQLTAASLLHTGEYTITVESEDGEFEPVEEEATVEDADEREETEVTVELEGATGDEEED